MQFSTVTTDKELSRLQLDWQILLANSSANALFSSFELADIFWRVFGGGAKLRVVCVHKNNRLIAIFPLYLRQRRVMKLFSLRVLQWIGTGGDTSPDYLGGIVHSDYDDQHEALCGQAVNFLQNEWDVCELRDMQQRIDIEGVRAACKSGLLHAGEKERPIILAELATDWDSYLAKLSSNRRQQIRRARRKAFDQEGIQLDRLTGAEQLQHWFDSLVQLHHKRWQQKGEGEHAFNTTSYNDFHLSLMASMLEGNALRLWGLSKDGRLIAVLYCLTDGVTTYYYQGGFDTDFDELKPGMVLMSCAMEEAIKEGCAHFNMMKGDYDFKRSLAKEEDRTFNVTLVRPTFSGLVYALRFILLPRVKSIFLK